MLSIRQTPIEVLDYEIDYSTRGLGTDTIASSSWVASSADCTLSNSTFTNTTTIIWLTGGIAANIYTLTNTAITAGGRTLQETIQYNCIAQRDASNPPS